MLRCKINSIATRNYYLDEDRLTSKKGRISILIGDVYKGHYIDHRIGSSALGVAFAAIQISKNSLIPKLNL
jgi:hypothetical protein